MNKITKLRQVHIEQLEKHCILNKVSPSSVLKLIDAEKTKKLLKRSTLIQSTINNEIEKMIENENK